MPIARRVFAYLRHYPWMAAGTIACAVISTAMVIVFPSATRLVIQEVLQKGHHEKLMTYVWLCIGAFVIQHGFNGLRIVLNNTFEQKVIHDLRSDLYSHIQRLPLRWFDNRATGDIMTRILEDVQSVERMLIDGVEQGVIALLQVLLVVVLLFWQSPTLALLALAPFPFLIAGALSYTLTAHRRYKQQRAAASAMNSLLHDNLAGIRQIKTFVRESEEQSRFESVSHAMQRASLKIMSVWAIYNPSMSLLNSIGLVLVLGFGGSAVIHGTMQVGDLVYFLLLVGFLYDPVSKLHQLNQLFQAGRVAGARVFEILDEPVEVATEARAATPAPEIAGEVRFQHVEFSYEDEAPVLHDVSLHARRGETVALVGHTGAGKSTLINLLTRFYEHTGGDILIDGRSIRDYPRDVLREAIGVVTQESFLFNGTVRENLRIGRQDATEEEMWRALDAANARAFVERMPKGLETIVGERGVKLSVGEKQRVSIARVLLKDPPILVLDEATASVDTATERQIQQALERLMENRTCFVIAHRLSTIRHADQILVMHHGRIVERGPHAELLELGGVYARLIQQSEFALGGEVKSDALLADRIQEISAATSD